MIVKRGTQRREMKRKQSRLSILRVSRHEESCTQSRISQRDTDDLRIFAFSLYKEVVYVVRSFLPNGVSLPCDHVLVFYISLLLLLLLLLFPHISPISRARGHRRRLPFPYHRYIQKVYYVRIQSINQSIISTSLLC